MVKWRISNYLSYSYFSMKQITFEIAGQSEKLLEMFFSLAWHSRPPTIFWENV